MGETRGHVARGGNHRRGLHKLFEGGQDLCRQMGTGRGTISVIAKGAMTSTMATQRGTSATRLRDALEGSRRSSGELAIESSLDPPRFHRLAGVEVAEPKNVWTFSDKLVDGRLERGEDKDEPSLARHVLTLSTARPVDTSPRTSPLTRRPPTWMARRRAR